jgi:ABC-type transport system substrate-binding protein
VAPRWAGANRGGYSNPEVDAIYDRLATTIPLAQRDVLVAQLLRNVTTELPVMFTLWDVSVITASGRVRGVSAPNPSTSHSGIAWNINEWDVTQ